MFGTKPLYRYLFGVHTRGHARVSYLPPLHLVLTTMHRQQFAVLISESLNLLDFAAADS